MSKKEFKKKYRKFKKLIRKEDLKLYGIRLEPIGRNGTNNEAWNLIDDLLEYKPFLNYILTKVLNQMEGMD